MIHLKKLRGQCGYVGHGLNGPTQASCSLAWANFVMPWTRSSSTPIPDSPSIMGTRHHYGMRDGSMGQGRKTLPPLSTRPIELTRDFPWNIYSSNNFGTFSCMSRLTMNVEDAGSWSCMLRASLADPVKFGPKKRVYSPLQIKFAGRIRALQIRPHM